MLICLDDLQWADAGTAEALRVLPVRLGGVPIIWIAAYRTAQAPALMLRSVAELSEANATRLRNLCVPRFVIDAGRDVRSISEVMYEEYAEQLYSLGVGPGRAIWTLLWDGRFSLLTGLLAGFGRASAEVGAVIIVGGNMHHVTRVMTTTIALETSKGNLALALALGILLMLLVLAVNAVAMVVRDTAKRVYG